MAQYPHDSHVASDLLDHPPRLAVAFQQRTDARNELLVVFLAHVQAAVTAMAAAIRRKKKTQIPVALGSDCLEGKVALVNQERRVRFDPGTSNNEAE